MQPPLNWVDMGGKEATYSSRLYPPVLYPRDQLPMFSEPFLRG